MIEREFAAPDNKCMPLYRRAVALLRERVDATRNGSLFTCRDSSTAYPIRAVRYWWAHTEILRDAARMKNKCLQIADIGCSHGNVKDFIGHMPDTRWIGLDWEVEPARLAEIGYEKALHSDFDKPLPLPDSSVDLVIFLHVLEHLPRPEFAMAEINRILRPGGALLAGSPVAPSWAACVRDKVHKRRFRKGITKPGGHIHSMSCASWRKIADKTNFSIEMLTGIFFCRWSGLYLENFAWWLRANLLWGSFVPALGGEIYLTLRKPC